MSPHQSAGPTELVRRFATNLTTYAVRERTRELWHELRLSLTHQASVRRARKAQPSTDLRLHLGCGSILKPGWINIDLHSDRADLRLDLREPWPFEDCSASVIYSEHLFEHFEHPLEVRIVLSEAWRVLAPGGTFSVGVPDVEFAVKCYLTRDEEYHRRVRELGLPPEVITPMDHLNYTFRQGREHKYAYDLETLTNVLVAAGFVDVARRPFDPILDSPRREWGTLYVDAIKPLVRPDRRVPRPAAPESPRPR